MTDFDKALEAKACDVFGPEPEMEPSRRDAKFLARWARRHTLESGKIAKLAEALGGLLNYSQHVDHNCGDPECPVDIGRSALAAFEQLKKKVG